MGEAKKTGCVHSVQPSQRPSVDNYLWQINKPIADRSSRSPFLDPWKHQVKVRIPIKEI